jgi:UDP-N-acetylmuramoyl-tripeptide--D-alanyl-D-alanine ligase
LRDMQAPAGRGLRQRIDLATGSIEIIDESYNASPEAVRAALAVLALAQPGRNGRRLAVLGDMLELGDDAPAQHAALASDLVEKNGAVDRVYAAGAGMASLFEALPAPLRGAHAADTAALAPIVAQAVRPGDVVLVKGSLGMNMARVMSALSALAGGASADRTAPAGHG